MKMWRLCSELQQRLLKPTSSSLLYFLWMDGCHRPWNKHWSVPGTSPKMVQEDPLNNRHNLITNLQLPSGNCLVLFSFSFFVDVTFTCSRATFYSITLQNILDFRMLARFLTEAGLASQIGCLIYNIQVVISILTFAAGWPCCSSSSPRCHLESDEERQMHQTADGRFVHCIS